MITIQLAYTRINGELMLVGRTVSDRWNMETLIGMNSPIPYERNHATLKRIRRRFKRFGFTFTVCHTSVKPETELSPAENEALTARVFRSAAYFSTLGFITRWVKAA